MSTPPTPRETPEWKAIRARIEWMWARPADLDILTDLFYERPVRAACQPVQGTRCGYLDCTMPTGHEGPHRTTTPALHAALASPPAPGDTVANALRLARELIDAGPRREPDGECEHCQCDPREHHTEDCLYRRASEAVDTALRSAPPLPRAEGREGFTYPDSAVEALTRWLEAHRPTLIDKGYATQEAIMMELIGSLRASRVQPPPREQGEQGPKCPSCGSSANVRDTPDQSFYRWVCFGAHCGGHPLKFNDPACLACGSQLFNGDCPNTQCTRYSPPSQPGRTRAALAAAPDPRGPVRPTPEIRGERERLLKNAAAPAQGAGEGKARPIETVGDLIAALNQLDYDLMVRVLEDNQHGDSSAEITDVQEWDGIAAISINAVLTLVEDVEAERAYDAAHPTPPASGDVVQVSREVAERWLEAYSGGDGSGVEYAKARQGMAESIRASRQPPPASNPLSRPATSAETLAAVHGVGGYSLGVDPAHRGKCYTMEQSPEGAAAHFRERVADLTPLVSPPRPGGYQEVLSNQCEPAASPPPAPPAAGAPPLAPDKPMWIGPIAIKTDECVVKRADVLDAVRWVRKGRSMPETGALPRLYAAASPPPAAPAAMKGGSDGK